MIDFGEQGDGGAGSGASLRAEGLKEFAGLVGIGLGEDTGEGERGEFLAGEWRGIGDDGAKFFLGIGGLALGGVNVSEGEAGERGVVGSTVLGGGLETFDRLVEVTLVGSVDAEEIGGDGGFLGAGVLGEDFAHFLFDGFLAGFLGGEGEGTAIAGGGDEGVVGLHGPGEVSLTSGAAAIEEVVDADASDDEHEGEHGVADDSGFVLFKKANGMGDFLNELVAFEVLTGQAVHGILQSKLPILSWAEREAARGISR